MYLKMGAATKIVESPWIPLTMKRGCAVELDDKICQAHQGYGVVARIDRRHIRLQFRLSFKLHFRRVHNADDQRTVHLQTGTSQDVVEGSTFEGPAGTRLHMYGAEEEVAWTERLGHESFKLGVFAVNPSGFTLVAFIRMLYEPEPPDDTWLPQTSTKRPFQALLDWLGISFRSTFR